MVAHAKPYFQTYAYEGVLESLAGLPFTVSFINFNDVSRGALADVDVLINAGQANTAFSGGDYWARPDISARIREFVADGGGFIGVGQPSACFVEGSGAFFQLSDVLGVDQEVGWTLSTDRYVNVAESHFIIEGFDALEQRSRGRGLKEINVLEVESQPQPGREQALLDIGPGVGSIIPTGGQVLQFIDGSVDLSVHEYGKGRSVYFAGLPYNSVNSRLLHRAIYWAGHAEERLTENYFADRPEVEVAFYPEAHKAFVYNNSDTAQSVNVRGPKPFQVTLGARESRWEAV